MFTILIPTLGRHKRMEGIIENIKQTTKGTYNLWFILEGYDSESIQEANRLGAKFIISNPGGSYVNAINYGYKLLHFQNKIDPFVFLGSDDIEFTPGWDKEMLKEFANEKVGVVGAWDNWPISKTSKHGSHLLIRTKYIQEHSGVEDMPGVIYAPCYNHYMCDIETEQTAMKRGAFVASPAEIKHHHWVNGEAQMDKTYSDGKMALHHDTVAYEGRRRKFEQFFFDDLFHGRVVPVNRKKLSIVIGSYNAPDALQKTLNSLMANTYHPFELIIVDDVSTEERTKEIIKELRHPDYKKFLLTEHIYTTAVWNYGVARANNDITFSKNWDVYLMNAFDDPDVYLANPYQTDDGEHRPYGVADRAGGINIRGTCFALSRESAEALFPLPKNLVMWFSDFWIAHRIEQLKKKSVFIERAVVHNLGSKSSISLQKGTGILWWIIRGDALQFEKMTGINTEHWLSVAEAQLPYGKK